jgi:hypothetical protein
MGRSDAVAVLVIIVFVAVAVLLIRLGHDKMDRDRVRNYIEARGGRMLEISWAPFRLGWIGRPAGRLYAVRFVAGDGSEHAALCQTSGWAGVFFTEDRVVQLAPGRVDELETLREENRRLRAELDRLRRGGAGPEETAIREM